MSRNNKYSNLSNKGKKHLDSSTFVSFFFFQAEDGIRDDLVTGVQTCALPISLGLAAFFGQHCLDHLRGLRLAETALAQEFGALVVGPCDNPLARRPDAIDERDRKSVV